MMKVSNACVLVLAGVVGAAGQASAGLRATTDFVEPGSWSVGDVNTTHQAWDVLTSSAANAPDAGLHANPVIGSAPTLRAVSPGFVAGSGNFYAFSDHYAFEADVYNHGGAAGAPSLPAGSGTHVIVQVAATLNPDFPGGPASMIPGSLSIVDLAGNAIVGGDAPLAYALLFEDQATSSFGTVSLREEAWEFFLPDYVGDFRVTGGVAVHSSFDRLRVDSAITSAPFPVTVPEPASMTLLALGAAAIAARRR